MPISVTVTPLRLRFSRVAPSSASREDTAWLAADWDMFSASAALVKLWDSTTARKKLRAGAKSFYYRLLDKLLLILYIKDINLTNI